VTPRTVCVLDIGVMLAIVRGRSRSLEMVLLSWADI